MIVSTRTLHYETKLAKFRGLIVPAVVAPADVYDLATDGELDQMLAFEGLTRGDLHPDSFRSRRTRGCFSLLFGSESNCSRPDR